jgi:CRISPR-associated protein Csm5
MITPFLDTTRCTISTLSPVHIGCGEDYYPTNYVIDDGLLHHFSEEGLLSALTLAEKNTLDTLAEYQRDNGIKKLQEFIYNKQDRYPRDINTILSVVGATKKVILIHGSFPYV